MERNGTGVCTASFGELLQGMLPSQRKFLVNFPIRRRSKATVTLSPPRYSAEKEAQIAASHQRFPKSYKLVRNVLADLGSHDDCLLEIDSEIPVGKGLSSSTADMVAAIRALGQALSLAFKETYLGQMLTEIEPNDGLQYAGTSAYHHTTGELIARVDWVPPFRIFGIDFGGIVDTVAFNEQKMDFPAHQCSRYETLLNDILSALRQHDCAAVGAIASESTRMWQAVRPRTQLDRIFELAAATGSEGVVNTHSGTFIGLLYSPDRRDWADIGEEVRQALPDMATDWFASLGLDMEAGCG